MEDIKTFTPHLLHFLLGCIGASLYFFCIKHGYGLPEFEYEELNNHSAVTDRKVKYTFIGVGGFLALIINFDSNFFCFWIGFLHRHILLNMVKMKSDIIKNFLEKYIPK
jgi:hypothetical protein